MKHSTSRIEHEIKLPMTPLIDVTFLLLIFFIFALRFQTLEGKLSAYLPVTHDCGGGPIEKVEILMEVVESGRRLDPFEEGRPWSERPGTRFAYDDSRVIQYSIGPRRTRDLDVLADRLQVLQRAGRMPDVTIDARRGIVYGDVARVIDLALEAGYTEVLFVGSYE